MAKKRVRGKRRLLSVLMKKARRKIKIYINGGNKKEKEELLAIFTLKTFAFYQIFMLLV